MKKLLSLFVVLLMLGVVPSVTPDVRAQATMDPVKEPSKVSLWFGKMKSKCEKAMEWVANSQVGQFVGDGIKYAKQGIAFAKEQYEAAMDLYNKTKDAVLNSKEYKAAMVSKEIAQETMKMKKTQEEKKQKLEEIEQQQELLKQQAQAKIANIQSNLNLNEKRMTEDAEKSGSVSSETQSFMSEQEKALEEIEAELEDQLDSLKSSAETIESEYNDKLETQAEKVADLGVKLNDILKDGDNKKETRSAKEIIQEQQDKLFLKAKEKADLATEKKKKKNRSKALNDSLDGGMQVVMGDVKLKESSSNDKVEAKQGVAGTMTGESEVSGVNTEVLGEQMNFIMNYIRLNLAMIKSQAIAELNGLHELKTSAADNKFDICQYTDPENRKSALEMAKSKAQKLQNNLNKAKDKFEAAKDKVEEISSTAKEAAAVAGELGSVTQGLGDSLKNGAAGMF
ncbi:MAG: hypothetical protein IJ482_00710 [Alphaproteobacteria bacterium]|nr:hypothetical protein [Alphaproteobacteria bacterium]